MPYLFDSLINRLPPAVRGPGREPNLKAGFANCGLSPEMGRLSTSNGDGLSSHSFATFSIASPHAAHWETYSSQLPYEQRESFFRSCHKRLPHNFVSGRSLSLHIAALPVAWFSPQRRTLHPSLLVTFAVLSSLVDHDIAPFKRGCVPYASSISPTQAIVLLRGSNLSPLFLFASGSHALATFLFHAPLFWVQTLPLGAPSFARYEAGKPPAGVESLSRPRGACSRQSVFCASNAREAVPRPTGNATNENVGQIRPMRTDSGSAPAIMNPIWASERFAHEG